MLRHVLLAVLLAAAVAVTGGTAQARGRTLEADLMKSSRVRIDGMLREWPRGIMRLSKTLKGDEDADTRASAMLGYDKRNLYVAFKVWDEDLVRTRAYRKSEDHAVLIIAFPSRSGRFTTKELLLFPGKPGKLAGVVKHKGGGKVRGSKIVEAPMRRGYTFEAQIPWSTFPPARRVRVGLRGALRYVDADAPGKITAVIGTSEARTGKSLPRLLLQSERGLEENIRRNNLGKADRELLGDVAGDKLLERVAIYGGYLTIVGPGYRKGKQFFHGEMGVSDASRVTRFELRDVDRDGKDEIVMQKRLGGAEIYRELLLILKVGADDTPEPIFLHDVAIVTPEGHIKNKVKLSRGRRGLSITISQGEAEWENREVFRSATQEDIPSALLPWGKIRSRTFEWDGSTFDKVRETKQRPRAPKGLKKRRRRRPEGPAAPPPPRPPNPEELLEKVYKMYRKERGLKKEEPRFDFVTDVTAGGEMERVLVHDRDIVVFGQGFLDGASFTYTTMGFADAKDVADVTARDLTGDGKAEIIARGVLYAEAGEELGGATIQRYAMYVYKVMGDRVHRVFAAETGRALGDNRILGAIAFKPSGGGLSIELRPGRAVGWTKRTYPFPPDTEAGGGLQPLLLPWSGDSYTYRFKGAMFEQD